MCTTPAVKSDQNDIPWVDLGPRPACQQRFRATWKTGLSASCFHTLWKRFWRVLGATQLWCFFFLCVCVFLNSMLVTIILFHTFFPTQKRCSVWCKQTTKDWTLAHCAAQYCTRSIGFSWLFLSFCTRADLWCWQFPVQKKDKGFWFGCSPSSNDHLHYIALWLSVIIQGADSCQLMLSTATVYKILWSNLHFRLLVAGRAFEAAGKLIVFFVVASVFW